MEYINTYINKLSYDNISDTIIDHTGADNWLDISTERCCRQQQFVAELHNWSS